MLKPIRRLVIILIGIAILGIHGNVLAFVTDQSTSSSSFVSLWFLGFLVGLVYVAVVPRKLKLVSLRVMNHTASEAEMARSKYQTYIVIIAVSLLNDLIFRLLKIKPTVQEVSFLGSSLIGMSIFFFIYALMNYQEVIKPPEP